MTLWKEVQRAENKEQQNQTDDLEILNPEWMSKQEQGEKLGVYWEDPRDK